MTTLATRPELQEFMFRGLENQKEKLKEEFQTAVVQGIAAAAGCNVARYSIDDGIDIMIAHNTKELDEAHIRFQLKCTASSSPDKNFVSVKVSKKRYDEYRKPNKTIPLILVAQTICSEQEKWIAHDGSYTIFGGRNFYLNLTGMEESQVQDGGQVTVRVPTSNVFDDDALIHLFAQLRKRVLKQ